MKNIELYNGVKIPQVGLGTWLIKDDLIYDVFNNAIKCGYTHFDSAQAYFNETNLGKAIKDSKIKRESLFITSKVMAEIKTYKEADESIKESFKKLDTPYIDLMLIHCPQPWDIYPDPTQNYDKANLEVWNCMIKYYKEGKFKAIGVSNFSISDIENLIKNSDVKPMVNQIICHIGNTDLELIDYCFKNNIAVEAYSPIAHGRLLNNEVVNKFANKYNCSIAQLCIAYTIQLGLIPLPKTLNIEHMKSNLDINFVISDEDMEILKNIK